MLKIKKGILEEMQSLADTLHPIEACGIIAAPEGCAVAHHLIAMQNCAHSDHYFRFNATEQFNVWKALEKNNEECRVIYHSHTNSIPYPSAEDIEFLIDPEIHYVIIAAQPRIKDIRSFRIIDKRVTEETIVVIDE